MPTTNRAFRLRRRPDGQIADGDLELVTEEVGALADGQALVRTKVLSVDPTARIWMSPIRGYLPPVAIDDVMRGLGVGEVVESRRADLPVGAHVLGWTGWQEHCVADDDALVTPFTVLPDPLPAPPSTFLGVLGHTGITAYLGVQICDPRPGETLVVSAAAGAVGSIAGQIATVRGARVVGIAGGPEKCRHVVEDLGFDVAVDYKAADWMAQLAAATPDGIDADFENVGGQIMDAVLARLTIGARVALCGMVSEYNSYSQGAEPPALRMIGQLIMQRASITGFLVLDFADRFEAIIAELAEMLEGGQLDAREASVDGLENAPAALEQLFAGANTGKLVVNVA